MIKKENYYIISGGTFVDVAPHFAFAAPAFGAVGRQLSGLLEDALRDAGRNNATVVPIFTRMAIGGADRMGYEQKILSDAGLEDLRTNADVAKLLDCLVADSKTKAIIMPAAICDFEATGTFPPYGDAAMMGKATHPRLDSESLRMLMVKSAEKVAKRVRRERKDIFFCLFKNTAGDDAPTQYAKGLKLLKGSSANLVFANDTRTHLNMVITPEQARYHESQHREEALRGFAEMIALRSHLRFTRSTVVEGEAVAWGSKEIPDALRRVVNHCIRRGAYKPFLGATVGHFAARGKEGSILTSRRGSDFNNLANVGLVRIEAKGGDEVIAYGSKPSVGGMSQRIIFNEHPDVDCIVHFHCPRKEASRVPVREQRPYECGSHECGQNTSDGLKSFAGVKAVMLDQHGPNVVFHHSENPARVIEFIEANFDLSGRTDGEVNLAAVA